MGPAQYPPFDEPQEDEPAGRCQCGADGSACETNDAGICTRCGRRPAGPPAISEPIRIRLKVYHHDGEPYVAVGVHNQAGSVLVVIMHDLYQAHAMIMREQEFNALPQYYFSSGTTPAAKTDFKHRPPGDAATSGHAADD